MQKIGHEIYHLHWIFNDDSISSFDVSVYIQLHSDIYMYPPLLSVVFSPIPSLQCWTLKSGIEKLEIGLGTKLHVPNALLLYEILIVVLWFCCVHRDVIYSLC